MNVELRMWNFELVARRAMKNYSIKNYLASYSIFLLVSPPRKGTNGRCSTLVEESNGVQAAVNDRNCAAGCSR